MFKINVPTTVYVHFLLVISIFLLGFLVKLCWKRSHSKCNLFLVGSKLGFMSKRKIKDLVCKATLSACITALSIIL